LLYKRFLFSGNNYPLRASEEPAAHWPKHENGSAVILLLCQRLLCPDGARIDCTANPKPLLSGAAAREGKFNQISNSENAERFHGLCGTSAAPVKYTFRLCGRQIHLLTFFTKNPVLTARPWVDDQVCEII
jgi:hypothetical protein